MWSLTSRLSRWLDRLFVDSLFGVDHVRALSTLWLVLKQKTLRRSATTFACPTPMVELFH